MRVRNIKLAVLLGVALSGFFLATPFAFADTFGQPQIKDAFTFGGVSSGVFYATSSPFVSGASGTTFGDIQILVSPQNGATSTEVSVFCNSIAVAVWDFDLTTATSSSLLQLSASADGVLRSQVPTVSANEICYVQWIVGNYFAFQQHPANILTAGLKHRTGADPDGTVSTYNIDEPYFLLSTGSTTINGFPIYISPTNYNSSFSTSTINTNCEPPANILDVGGGVRYGICASAQFLFAPNMQAVNQWTSIPTLFQSRFPISWFSDIQTLISSLTASSTANYPTYSYAIGTTTLGIQNDIIGTGLQIANPTTIQALAPDSTWSFIRTLIGYILWISFGYFVYGITRRLFRYTL